MGKSGREGCGRKRWLGCVIHWRGGWSRCGIQIICDNQLGNAQIRIKTDAFKSNHTPMITRASAGILNNDRNRLARIPVRKDNKAVNQA